MNRNILFLLLFLPLLYAQTEECVKCEEVALLTPTKMVVLSDEINHLLRISLYNATSRQPLPNAVIIIHRYNGTVHAFEKVFTDERGSATYNFSAYKDGCYTYQMLFCSCEKDAVKKCCFEINNIDITKPGIPDSMDDIPLAPNQPQLEPSEIIYDYRAFPSTEIYSYCRPQAEAASTPAFCLPLAIIFALLGGSLMLTGRNPLRGFDLGGIRVGRHIKYESRGRFAGYTVSPVQVTGVIRKAKAEKVEKAVAATGEAKGRVGTIADRFRRQVITPVKGVPAGIKQAKGAMAAAKKDLSKGASGIAAQYKEAGKLLGRAGLQAISTPIDALRTSTGGPEMMIGPDGRPIPIRRGAEMKGGGVSGIFALLGAILPAKINVQKLQADCYELLKTRGERIAEKMMLQEKLELLIERTKELTAFQPVKEKGGKKYENVSFTLEKARPPKVEGHEVLNEATTPDGKKAFVAGREDGSVVLVPEGTPLYGKFIQKIKESEETVGKIRVEIPGNGVYSIEKDEKGKIRVYKDGDAIDIKDPKVQESIIKDPAYRGFRGDAGLTFTKINVGGRGYSFSKNDKGEISVYATIMPENVTKTNLGAGIVAAYKEAIKANSDFVIGKKSEILMSYNEAMAEWQQAKEVVRASQVEFVKSNLEEAKTGFLEQPETIEAADKIMVDKVKGYVEMLEESAEKIKPSTRTEKKLQQRILDDADMLREGIALIGEYGKAAMPEKLKAEERVTIEQRVSGAKEKPGEITRVEEKIEEYNKKVNGELGEIMNELAAGMDATAFRIRMRQAEGLSSVRDYLESKAEGSREKAVGISTNLLSNEELDKMVQKNPGHPFTGAAELERLTRHISNYYADLYRRQDYGKQEVGPSRTLEYEKRLDELAASEGLVLKDMITNRERVEFIKQTKGLLANEHSKLEEEEQSPPSVSADSGEKNKTAAKNDKST